MAGLAIVKAQAECARLQALVEMLTAKDPDAALQDQVAELWRRVDRAEADRAASQEREAKLAARAEAAERRAAELEDIISTDLASLRAVVATLAASKEQTATTQNRGAVPRPVLASQPARPRRRGLIRILLGQ